jgi:hypothetical protein
LLLLLSIAVPAVAADKKAAKSQSFAPVIEADPSQMKPDVRVFRYSDPESGRGDATWVLKGAPPTAKMAGDVVVLRVSYHVKVEGTGPGTWPWPSLSGVEAMPDKFVDPETTARLGPHALDFRRLPGLIVSGPDGRIRGYVPTKSGTCTVFWIIPAPTETVEITLSAAEPVKVRLHPAKKLQESSPPVSPADSGAHADLTGDITELIAAKVIAFEVAGNEITNVAVRLKRRVPRTVTVEIPVGTFFVASARSSQNMVGKRSVTVKLEDDAWHPVEVATACANRPRNIPGSDDRFTIQRAPSSKTLQKLMPALEKAGAGEFVEQAAVWIVTDDADYEQLGTLIVSTTTQFGGLPGTTTSGRAIGESEAAEAMRICEDAGIAIKEKAIWADRKTILKGLPAGDLRAWLEERISKKAKS